jgi:hypothetical protein
MELWQLQLFFSILEYMAIYRSLLPGMSELTILTLWRAEASRFVSLVYLVRNLPFRQEKPEEDVGSHKVHKVRQVHKEDRLSTSRHFPANSLANRSTYSEFTQ